MSKELKIDAEDLTKEVAWLTKMRTGSTPEQAVIQVTALLGAIMLRRTNFDQWQETVLPAEGVGQAAVLVDAAKLTAGLKTVAGPLVVTIDDQQLSIKSSARTVRLRGASLDFPTWPTFESTAEQATIGARQLARVLTSVGVDETLPALMVVAFDNGTMVTTDRFRLSAISYGTSGFTAKVPQAALRAFAKSDGVVYVEPGKCADSGEKGWVELTSAGRTVTALMPTEDFPRWRRLIPEKPPVQVALRRDELLAAAGGEEIAIVIKPGEETVTVTSHDDGVEIEQNISLVSVVRHDVEGPFAVRMRSRYVNECLRGIGSGVVLLSGGYNDSGRAGPVVFQDVAESDLHLIMPVRGATG